MDGAARSAALFHLSPPLTHPRKGKPERERERRPAVAGLNEMAAA